MSDSMNTYKPVNFDNDELLYFNQKTAIQLKKRYVCAYCFHTKGIATHLHYTQRATDDRWDRYLVYCTECGGNVADRSVGRITLWFLAHLGQKFIERAMEITAYERSIEREREKEAGTYHFDEQAALKELGF